MAEKQQYNLIVLTFEGQSAAEAFYRQIEQMEDAKLGVIEDAVIIEREESYSHSAAEPTSKAEQRLTSALQKSLDDSVRVKQTRGKKGKYATIGGGIGLLAAAILGGPIGLAVISTAGLGAVTAALKDFGVNDDTVNAIKQSLQPNTSALLLLGKANDRDAFLAKLREFDAKVVMTSLAPEVERELQARLQG